MEKYGSTIRKIRKSKGFSQKEIYTGILSKSFAIDFEKGLYDIKFSLMIKILSRLMISVDELILIHNDFHNPVIDDSLFELDMEKFREDAAYSKKIEIKMQEEAYKNKDSASRIRYMEILALKAFYRESDYKKSHDYQIAKRNIQKYLFDVESWNLSELRLFSDMSFLYEDGEGKTELFKCAWNSIEKYKYYPDFAVYICHLLTNNLFHLIYTEQYSIAKKAIDRLYELTKDVTMLTWKVILFYLEGLYYYANGEIEKGLNEIEIAKKIYCVTGNNFMVEKINLELEMIQNQKK